MVELSGGVTEVAQVGVIGKEVMQQLGKRVTEDYAALTAARDALPASR